MRGEPDLEQKENQGARDKSLDCVVDTIPGEKNDEKDKQGRLTESARSQKGEKPGGPESREDRRASEPRRPEGQEHRSHVGGRSAGAAAAGPGVDFAVEWVDAESASDRSYSYGSGIGSSDRDSEKAARRRCSTRSWATSSVEY